MSKLDDILEGVETVNGMMRIMADLVEAVERRDTTQSDLDILTLIDELRARAEVYVALAGLVREGKLRRDADGNYIAC